MKRIIVLAISAAQDGLAIKKDIEEIEEEVEVTIVTQIHELNGLQGDEWVMSETFSNQRSIRLLSGAMKAVVKRTPQEE